MNSSLRQFVRLVLSESAVQLGQASKSGLALSEFRTRGSLSFTLYDPRMMLEIITMSMDAGGEPDAFALDALRGSGELEYAIKGYIQVRIDHSFGPCYGAAEVAMSAANKGYGPMMYDIAMASVPNHTLISDRGYVSKHAANVWHFYMANRSDVEKLKLDDIHKPQTPPKHDDCQLSGMGELRSDDLNFAYRAKGGTIDVGNLKRTHDDVTTQANELISKMIGQKYEKFDALVRKIGLDLFDTKFENV